MQKETRAKLQFWGAAGTVTGSKTLVRYNNKKVLIDCGMFQGLKELRLKNRDDFPVDPSEIDAVILTHAHLDHCGMLPALVKNGFAGNIHCTAPTAELAKIILLDSAKIQEEEAEEANKRGYSSHKEAKPLYDRQDAELVFPLFKIHDNSEYVFIDQEIKFQFHHAGLILGAAMVEMELGEETIVFSGDIGRQKPHLLYPPKKLEKADYIVLESTYGNRNHPDEDPVESLERVILETLDRQGILMIPTFAVERAQEIIYFIAKLRQQEKIPRIPFYLDSPMAKSATEVFYRFPDWHLLSNEDVQMMQDECTMIEDYYRSQMIIQDKKPKIVLAGSGMITGGRILYYLQKHMGNPNNTILLAGFQAEGTRGRSLMNGEKELKFFGDWYKLKAKVEHLNALSAHGDQTDLLDWVGQFENRPKKIFLNHGEPMASHCLALKLKDTLNLDAEETKMGLTYRL
ncbi:MBL fold metallo-hydrolase [Salibacter sp.]|uniref:MBL fold metallo-hydrolase n=1 Tax=Salibacter sp. TaxID=2010995 RepID=UPI00286FEE88|nr:MBL fold metallo-hydrolase [Salibacter sp.]MDR9398757.1 MBL fold metallo-hydrolase [Salibacter sp.]MDR9488625.1 MBL fold metallo-hydrolase [Salibacter sp.]